jgi:hypothetical protein
MGIRFTYEVMRLDASGYKIFHNQTKAEEYARSLKHNDEDKIQITRTAKGFAPYVYYV